MTQSLTLLGLESSCDDTAAAVVRGAPGAAQQLDVELTQTQTESSASSNT